MKRKVLFTKIVTELVPFKHSSSIQDTRMRPSDFLLFQNFEISKKKKVVQKFPKL